MPKTALLPHPTKPNEMIIPAEALRTRIDRFLHTLLPYRSLVYNRKDGAFYVQITGDGPNDPQHMTRQGPYYYQNFAGLARWLNMFSTRGYGPLPPVTVIDPHGQEYPEKLLPAHLRFQVITPLLAKAIQTLRSIPVDEQNKIWDKIRANPQQEVPLPENAVTMAVTREIEQQDEYEELTEEQERILKGEP